MRIVSYLGAIAHGSHQRQNRRKAPVALNNRNYVQIASITMWMLPGAWIAFAPPPAIAASASDAPISIIAGKPEETSLAMANDLAAALGEASGQRILTVVGRSSTANMADLTNLQGNDFAITQTDALDQLKSGATPGPALNTRIGIVAKLHDAELHILAGKGIDRIEDLAGKTVNLCAPDSGTELTARTVLSRLGITVQTINVSHDTGLAKVASGEIAATLLVTGKPARALQRGSIPEGIKLLALPFPPQLDGDYMPATLSYIDYPGLIERGQRIDTLAVGVILAAPLPTSSDTRNERITTFVNTFFSGIEALQEPAYHPKWRDTNLSVTLPGWSRHPAAERWLASHTSTGISQPVQTRKSAIAEAVTRIDDTEATDPMIAFAQKTRAANGNPVEQERLFKAFLESSKRQQPAKTASTEAAP